MEVSEYAVVEQRCNPAFGKGHVLLMCAESDHFASTSCRRAGFFVVLSVDSCTRTLISKGKFTVVHDKDSFFLFVRYANCYCVAFVST